MNKQTKNFIPTLIIFLLIFISGLFVYVFSKAEIRKMLRQKDYLGEKMNELNNTVEMKIVEVQKLISEDRIVPLAEERLNLARNRNDAENIKINNAKLLQIKELIRLKYE